LYDDFLIVEGRGLSAFICFFHCLYITDVWVGSFTGHPVYENLGQIKIISVSKVIIIMALIRSVKQTVICLIFYDICQLDV